MAGRQRDERRVQDAEHVPAAIDDWVLPRLPYRSVRGDVAMSIGVLAIGLAVAFTGFGRPPVTDANPAVPVLATVVTAAALLVKRRLPAVTVVVVGAVLAGEAVLVGTGLNLAVLIALFDALYAAALLGTPLVRRAVVAGCAVVTVVLLLLGDASLSERLQRTLSLLALLGGPLFIGTATRQRDALVRAEKARAEAERARADAVARAAVAERLRAVRAERATLARDLHDAVAGHLSAIALQSGAAMSRAADVPDLALRSVRESSLEALTELRQLIDVLSADDPGELPLKVPPGIDETEILRADAQRLGVTLRLAVDAPREALTTATSHVLMRIARESVVNAARHAPGSPLTLTVHARDGEVELTAVNPLPAGLPPEVPDGGLGTVIMAEQAAAVGGSCTAGRGDGGWVVRARVPRAVHA